MRKEVGVKMEIVEEYYVFRSSNMCYPNPLLEMVVTPGSLPKNGIDVLHRSPHDSSTL